MRRPQTPPSADLPPSARRIYAVLRRLESARGRGITDEEFGVVVGEAEQREPWGRDVVSRWLAGKRVPRKSTRATLASLVGLTLNEFDAWDPGGSTSGDTTGRAGWMNKSLLRQLNAHLADLRRAGATPIELWAAEQLLTHEAIRHFAVGGSDTAGSPSVALSVRPNRGSPEDLIVKLWRAIAEELLAHLKPPPRLPSTRVD